MRNFLLSYIAPSVIAVASLAAAAILAPSVAFATIYWQPSSETSTSTHTTVYWQGSSCAGISVFNPSGSNIIYDVPCSSASSSHSVFGYTATGTYTAVLGDNGSGSFSSNCRSTLSACTGGYGGTQVSYTFTYMPSSGCTDPVALNYDSGAGIDDGSCLYRDYETGRLDIHAILLYSTAMAVATFCYLVAQVVGALLGRARRKGR